jgi:uncharacterized membrane protein
MADFLTNAIGWEMKLKKFFKIHPEKSIKPIGCMYCTAGWLGLILYFLPSCPVILVMFGAAYLTKYL